MEPVKTKHWYYADIKGPIATVIGVGRWIDIAGKANSIFYRDTLSRESSQVGVFYNSPRSSIQLINGKTFLIVDKDRRKSKQYEIDTVSDRSLVNERINNGYWWTNFHLLSRELSDTLHPYYYSFRDGFHFWNSFSNKSMEHLEFEKFSDQLISSIRDSVLLNKRYLDGVADNIRNTLPPADYNSFSQSFQDLAAKPGSNRQFAMLTNEIAINHPALYFRLLEDMTGQRDRLLTAIEKKSTIKQLKAFPGESPGKTIFVKSVKSDRKMKAGMIAAGAAGAGLITTALFVLIN